MQFVFGFDETFQRGICGLLSRPLEMHWLREGSYKSYNEGLFTLAEDLSIWLSESQFTIQKDPSFAWRIKSFLSVTQVLPHIYNSYDSCKTNVDLLWVWTSQHDTWLDILPILVTIPDPRIPATMSQLREVQRLKAENRQLWSEIQRLQAENQAAKNKEIAYKEERVRRDWIGWC